MNKHWVIHTSYALCITKADQIAKGQIYIKQSPLVCDLVANWDIYALPKCYIKTTSLIKCDITVLLVVLVPDFLNY